MLRLIWVIPASLSLFLHTKNITSIIIPITFIFFSLNFFSQQKLHEGFYPSETQGTRDQKTGPAVSKMREWQL